MYLYTFAHKMLSLSVYNIRRCQRTFYTLDVDDINTILLISYDYVPTYSVVGVYTPCSYTARYL